MIARCGETLVTAPSVEPITYSEIKALLQVGDDTVQTWLTSRITTARQTVERDTSRKLITQTWDLTLDAFPADGVIVLPFEPLQSVTSVTVTASDGTSSVVAASNYTVITAASPPRIALSDTGSWPGDVRTVAGIVIRVVVGYGTTAASVPGPLVYAMEQLLAQWYASRVGTAYVPPPRWLGYDATIAPYRPAGIG